ncbi:hypothetical protein TRFO_05477 [Tritrichomonas foetus]|uniref:Uncharacterized protein n=1 Tax=Tritrichomonas foetus TaxID=1144522 RepID=A0A1J4KAS5_9EUKA|nr:hypothetical protein TRFO_05477 [Tritrichomonas foetus]|eukprot:OHT06782.1 hypothetical protein TRFO_05477 [Tritrichomonas foetus]
MSKVHRSPKTFTPDNTFTLYMGKARYIFEGDIFAKMSKKCARLVRQGIHQGTIMKKIRQDTFEAFIAACQLQPFKVSAANAYELLDLAIDWMVPSLEKFANDFIKSKDLPPPPPIDYLEVLKDHCNLKIQDINDIRAVAAIINKALVDARFASLPPEIIFQTILTADPHTIDQQLLVNFVLSMFDKKQSTAVPQTLQMDFDLLNNEQKDKVFFSKKMHEQNINFFVAWSLSAARNRAERDLQENYTKFHQDFGELYESLKKANRTSRNKLKKIHEQEIADMNALIAKQKKEIEDLIEQAREEDKRFDEDEYDHQEQLEKMREELQKIEEIGQECNLGSPGAASQVKAVVKEQINQLREDLDKQIQGVRDVNEQNLKKIFDELMHPIEEFRKVITDLFGKSDQMTDSIEDLKNTITTMKATLTAKIVRDKLRCDKFIRATDDRFKLFKTKPPIWGLSPKQVEDSEQFILGLEERLDQLCPIRGNQQCSPPQTPMAMMMSRNNDPLNLEKDTEFATLPLSPTKSP